MQLARSFSSFLTVIVIQQKKQKNVVNLLCNYKYILDNELNHFLNTLNHYFKKCKPLVETNKA